MRAAAFALAALVALPGSASAQEPAPSGARFGQDVVSPLLIDTIQMIESGRLASDPRPEGSLPRARRCHGLMGKAAEYRRLGLLPQNGTGFGDMQRGAASGLGLPVGDYMIRALLDRCRQEAEDVCRRTGDVKAVVEAVQAMAMIRTVFADVDIDRRAAEPALTGAFRRAIGDSDHEWMRRTLDACGRFELVWRSRHRHQCRELSAPWRQDVTQRFEIRAVAPVFNPADDSPAGVFGAELAFEATAQPAQVTGAGPGRQKAGLTFSYEGLSAARDGEVRVVRIEIGDEGRLDKLAVRFSPPTIIESAVVTVPRAGRVLYRHDHWREGFLSAYPGQRQGDMIEVDDFAGSASSARTEIMGRGVVLRDTEGCVPDDSSVFDWRHGGR